MHFLICWEEQGDSPDDLISTPSKDRWVIVKTARELIITLKQAGEDALIFNADNSVTKEQAMAAIDYKFRLKKKLGKCKKGKVFDSYGGLVYGVSTRDGKGADFEDEEYFELI